MDPTPRTKARTYVPGEEAIERNVSANVRAFMGIRKMSQAALGAVLGIDQTSAGRKLRNQTPWSMGDLRILGEEFDIEPQRFLDDPVQNWKFLNSAERAALTGSR